MITDYHFSIVANLKIMNILLFFKQDLFFLKIGPIPTGKHSKLTYPFGTQVNTPELLKSF